MSGLLAHRGLLLGKVPTGTFAAEVAADAPYIWWRLGELSGTAMADSSGGGRAATIFGGAGTDYDLGEPGLVGDANAAIEIKSNPYVKLNTAITAPVANITLSCAVKINSGAGAGHILGFYSGASPGTGSGSRDRFLYINSSGKLVAGVWSGVASTIVSSASLNDGVRHLIHFASGADATAGSELYIDGVSVGTMAAISVDTGARFLFAGRNNLSAWPGGADAAARGIIDECAFYTTRLSAARILAQAQAAGLA